MIWMVPVALFGWIPLVLLLFATLPARRAVLIAFLGGWMLLPVAGYHVVGLTEYTKATAISLGVLAGILTFDAKRLRTLQPSWLDLPLGVWLLAKFGASLANGYGVYDGLSAVEYHLLNWGVPYLCGRLYFRDLIAIRELSIAIVMAGLVYAPLCLYEVRMSPQLHNMVYGFHQHQFIQSRRFEGWRPTVFMQHGLMVAMWMTSSALLATWLWWRRSVNSYLHISSATAAIALLIIAVLCKSVGSWALLLAGGGVLFAAWQLRSALPIWCLLLLVPLYMTTRLSGVLTIETVLGWVHTVADPDRTASLQTRLRSEEQFIRGGFDHPLFGFRGWYNTRAYWAPRDQLGQGVIPDAFWMIEFTGCGLLGLAGFTLFMLLPPALILLPAHRRWPTDPAGAVPIGLAVIMVVLTADCLLNAMITPVFGLGSGALLSLAMGDAAKRSRVLPRASRARSPRQVGAAMGSRPITDPLGDVPPAITNV